MKPEPSYAVVFDPDPFEEPSAQVAIALRLLTMAKARGWALTFLVPERVQRAFPAIVETALAEGHRVGSIREDGQKEPPASDLPTGEPLQLAEAVRSDPQLTRWAAGR